MDSNAVALAAIGLASTTVLTLAAMLNWATRKLSKDLNEHSRAAVKQSRSNTSVAKAMDRVADSNDVIAIQSEKRNGHLADLIVQTGDRTLDAIQVVKQQVVEHQEVKQAILKKAIIKDKKE